ncbi:MAG: hypothetical protein ACR2F4_00370, partial [Thermoleophilaceae bacterium]
MPDPDHALRMAANEAARRLSHRFDDLVPLRELRAGRRQEGPAALTLTTAPIAPGKVRPYDDELDATNRTIIYHYRSGSIDQPDNRALRAAHAEQVPLVYFHGLTPGQYM